MKRMRLALFVVLMLAMSLCFFTAQAAEEVEISLTGGYVGEDDYVRIPLSVDSGTTKIDYLYISGFTYDEDAFEFAGFELNPVSIVDTFTVGELDADNGIIDLSFSRNSVKSGAICNVVFRVIDGAAHDSYSFGAEGYVMSDADEYGILVNEADVTLMDLERGDINIDGDVNIDDAIVLFQHSMMPSLYPISYLGVIDFEKSGFIDLDDAIILFQHSMMPDIYKVNKTWESNIEEKEDNDDDDDDENVVITEPGEAYFLIDDYLMADAGISSGWLYDYTGGNNRTASSSYVNSLVDTKTTDSIRLYRSIQPQNDGVLTLESSFYISSGFGGMLLNIYDEDDNIMFTMGTTANVNGTNSQGVFFTDGDEIVEIAASSTSLRADSHYHDYSAYYSPNYSYRQIRPRIVFDLEERTAKVQISGKDFGTFNLVDGTGAFAKVEFATGTKETVQYVVRQVHLYKDYRVFDNFRTDLCSAAPYGYETQGNVTVQFIKGISENQGDFYSVKAVSDAVNDTYARRNFDAMAENARYELQLLPTTGADGTYFLIGSKDTPALKIVTSDNKFYLENEDGTLGDELRSFTPNVWQELALDADATAGTATVRINGKIVAQNVPFISDAYYIDYIEFGTASENSETVWFDDVKAYRLFEYDDYVPEPVPLDTGDYVLSMSVCNLWRNGSHYGWKHISPYAELEPITGYYDEGIPEEMDWEIKFLVEHGVQNYNMCWYSPNASSAVPVRKSRMNDALHDGYFNAKYADYLNFSIMWENSNHTGVDYEDAFKEYIFSYWMEWYFSDERYFRINDDGEEKLLLTVYKYDNFRNMFLDTKNPDASQLAEAERRSRELIEWMGDQIREAGYADGIIVIFNHSGWQETTNEQIKNLGATAIYPYAWGDTAWELGTQKRIVNDFYQQSKNVGLDLLALATMGFNNIGWAYDRKPLMSDADFEELLTWFRDDYMPRYSDDEDSWKQYFIQFDTWNEYGEGHYMYPTVGMDAIDGEYGYDGYGGYGYLEAAAKVFGSDYDEALHEDLDIIPTEEQKSRLGHLYINETNLIRREFMPDKVIDEPMPEIGIAKYNFNGSNTLNTLLENRYLISYDTDEQALKMTSNNNDPIIWLNTDLVKGKSADDIDVLHIRMKTTKGSTIGQIFYKTSTMTSDYNEADSITFAFGEPGVWVDYYIDTKQYPSFTGTIEKIRFDPGSAVDNTIYLSDFEFLSYSEAQKNNHIDITIDAEAYNQADYGELQYFDRNEVYLAPTDNGKFYMRSHMFYEWYKDEGRLYLDTPSGTNFEFTEGSDVVIVNGSDAEELARPFEIYDGVPVLPLLYILDRAEYNYMYDYDNRTLEIYVNSYSKTFVDIENGRASDVENTEAFYSGNASEVSIVENPDYEYNHVWRVIGADNTDSTIKTELDLLDGYDYTVEFDIYIDSLNGEDYWNDPSYEIFFVAEYAEYGTDETVHPLDSVSVSFGSWQHVKYTFSTSRELDDDAITETLGFYIEPDAWDGYGINFYMDNFLVIEE